MSWPVFAVIQLALMTVGVAVAFWLRNRELKTRLNAQEQAIAEAAALVDEASERFESVVEEARDKWLAERTRELDESDPVQKVQQLVLQNEKEPIPDFAETMRRQISAGHETQDNFGQQWREARTDSYQTACNLIERFPRSHPVLVQLYDAFGALDAEHGVELPPLPEPVVPAASEEAGGSEETEHLRAANDLLLQQLAETQKELAAARTSREDAQEQEADLKALLQQFTRDSRDMMACIQELEQENQRLRDQPAAQPSAEDGQGDAGGAETDHAA
jgi:hypothetical protein